MSTEEPTKEQLVTEKEETEAPDNTGMTPLEERLIIGALHGVTAALQLRAREYAQEMGSEAPSESALYYGSLIGMISLYLGHDPIRIAKLCAVGLDVAGLSQIAAVVERAIDHKEGPKTDKTGTQSSKEDCGCDDKDKKEEKPKSE